MNVSHLVLHARSDYAIYSCSYLAYLLHYIPTLTPNNSTEDGAYGMGENDMGQLGIGTNVGKGATVTTPARPTHPGHLTATSGGAGGPSGACGGAI